MTFFVPPSEDPYLILPEPKSRHTCGAHLQVDGMEAQEGP